MRKGIPEYIRNGEGSGNFIFSPLTIGVGDGEYIPQPWPDLDPASPRKKQKYICMYIVHTYIYLYFIYLSKQKIKRTKEEKFPPRGTRFPRENWQGWRRKGKRN